MRFTGAHWLAQASDEVDLHCEKTTFWNMCNEGRLQHDFLPSIPCRRTIAHVALCKQFRSMVSTPRTWLWWKSSNGIYCWPSVAFAFQCSSGSTQLLRERVRQRLPRETLGSEGQRLPRQGHQGGRLQRHGHEGGLRASKCAQFHRANAG